MFESSCIKCGKLKLTKRQTKSKLCVDCARTNIDINNRWENHELIRYTRTCVDCGNVRKQVNLPKEPQLCGSCNRIRLGRARTEANKLKPIIKYYRICPKCPDNEATIQVASLKNSGIKLCRKHRPHNPKPYKARTKPNKVSEESIIKARKINKEHREAEAKLSKVGNNANDEGLIKQWLSKHKPTVIKVPKGWEHYNSKIGEC